MRLDAIATGSGVLVVREPQQITVLTDLAGVWPVFYATVGGVLVYSSSASAVARYVGGCAGASAYALHRSLHTPGSKSLANRWENSPPSTHTNPFSLSVIPDAQE